ncbi:LacI family DNA-binding transcriptional regulator [Saccharibacillus sp. CPCC 101409]|uniref:LacI family DNA-binding transcriptional regulator n=1 Tax=Saccharibacillus sp. CPCC 101409 TaxID=3058041 RepID=UPI002672B3C6|nr:LacI family DNA-binding transcriptional regulator [Saccharibacillus sp. CPCC 101409]MDO3408814.1 LacI family DNA-binding transcriptional regulator [Saccharibacillus sp. CPCC 101409]
MASIHDVAKEAGVSVATVSKVINNYPDVSDKTRKKVSQTIKQLKYHPNVAARGLVKGRSWTVGVFVTTPFTNPFVAELLEGIKTALQNSGYDLVHLSTRFDDPSYSFLEHCMSRNVDGVLVFGVDRDDPHLEELLESDMPTMFVDADIQGRRAGYITTENRAGIMQAVEHLAGLGHSRIAFISGELDNAVGVLRLEGYTEGMKAHGLRLKDEYVKESDYSMEGGVRAMTELLELEERPTAVVCTSDMMAFGAINVIHRSGLNVPDDISVIGFDNTYYAEIFSPALTTVNQNIRSIGSHAIETLIAMVENADFEPPVVTEPSNLIVRRTTAKPRNTVKL